MCNDLRQRHKFCLGGLKIVFDGAPTTFVPTSSRWFAISRRKTKDRWMSIVMNKGTRDKFTFTKGLSGLSGSVSIRSVENPQYYPRFSGNALLFFKYDGSTSFKKQASYFARPGLDGEGGGYSFESAHFKGMYIQHHLGRMVVGFVCPGWTC